MKKLILTCLLVGLSAFAFEKSASVAPELVQSGKSKQWCNVCGMSLKKFYKTSYIAYSDDKPKQFCSIACLSHLNKNAKFDLSKVKVVDVKSQKYILAKDAFFVVGSKVHGTMSKVSKLAFGKKDEAEQFIKKMGGEIKNFDEVVKIVNDSMKSDMAVVSKKRAKMMYPMGEKLYNKKCKKDKIDLNKYASINELKADVMKFCSKKKSCGCDMGEMKKSDDKHSKMKHKDMKKSACHCGGLKMKQAQAISLYLWDKVKHGEKGEKIELKNDDKCPVCGMFVKKYPKWVAQIIVEDKKLSFDGVKDLVKYLNSHKDLKIKKILVNDYYAQKAIDGKEAFYVIGSDVYGPMGNELIPFKLKSDAKSFRKDHKAEKILKLNNITEDILKSLDGTK